MKTIVIFIKLWHSSKPLQEDLKENLASDGHMQKIKDKI